MCRGLNCKPFIIHVCSMQIPSVPAPIRQHPSYPSGLSISRQNNRLKAFEPPSLFSFRARLPALGIFSSETDKNPLLSFIRIARVL
jgi:hypothetical protein